MKLGGILIIFPILALSMPVQPAPDLPECDDHSYPTRELFTYTAKQFCEATFMNDYKTLYKVKEGYHRRFYDIETYDSTPSAKKTRTFSFQLGMKDAKQNEQEITLGQCVNAFKLNHENTRRYKPCVAGGVQLMHDLKKNLHKEGFGDIWFESYPGY